MDDQNTHPELNNEEAKPEPAAPTPEPENVEGPNASEAGNPSNQPAPAAEPEPEANNAAPVEQPVELPVATEATAEGEATAPVGETVTQPQPAEATKRAWYVVHCYSGYENKVKKSLEQRITNMDVEGLIFRIIVPTEEEIDVREGQRKVVQRRVFPGYVLIEMMQYDPENPDSKRAWYVVRNTPGVTGFVSSGDIPTPLREDEVGKILKRMETDQPKVRVTYRKGQTVHIIDGPFADFRGTVDEVNMEKGKVRVMVSFFGRETPVELDLLQVEKV